MKSLLLVLLVTMSSAFAFERPGDPVYIRPRIYNFGNQVQVDVWNTTNTDIECRGSVTLHGQRNIQTEYYWETIYRGMSRTRTYWLRDFNDRVTFTNEFIQCYER